MNGPSPVLIGPQLTKLVGLTKVTSQVIQRPWFRLLHNSKSFFSRWTRVIWTKQRRNSWCWDRDESIAPAIDLFPNSTYEDDRTLGYSTAFVLRGLRRSSFFGHFVPIERASRSNLINQRRNSRSCDRDEPIAPFFVLAEIRPSVDGGLGLGRPAEIRPADVCAGPAGRKILSLAKKIFFSENLLRILTFLRTPSLRLIGILRLLTRSA